MGNLPVPVYPQKPAIDLQHDLWISESKPIKQCLLENKNWNKHGVKAIYIYMTLPLHWMKGDHFLFLVLAGKMELYVQGQSSFQEMTCFPAHNGKTHKVHLLKNEQALSFIII